MLETVQTNGGGESVHAGLQMKTIKANGTSGKSSGDAESPLFVFDDADHHNYLLDKLNTLRRSKQFCDVILQVGTQQDVHEIYAHRAVLASSSAYFLDIFTNDYKTNACGIPLYKMLNGNYDGETFEQIIDYVYTARIEVRKDRVRAVYALANRLKLPAVANACGQYMASTLTPDSCLGVRSIPGVLADPILLNAVDKYIKSSIDQVAYCKSLEALPKIKVEVLHNNREERALSNEKQLLTFVVEWIRKSYDSNCSLENFTEKVFMLYLNKIDKRLHDCNDIQIGDFNCTTMVQDYKRMSRKLSHGSKNGTVANNNGCHEPLEMNGTLKPRQMLFTRSDSESSLSSLADDDESDWKVLGTHQTFDSKHTIMGLVMIAGRLCVLTIKMRINDVSRSESTETENEVDDTLVNKQDDIVQVAPMTSARCAAGTACLQGKLFVCGGYDRGECLNSVEQYDLESNSWKALASMKNARGRFDIAVVSDRVYAIGGSDGHTELSVAELYDPVENVWKVVAKCPVARSNAGVVSLNGKVYIVGGWNGERGLKRCDVFDPEAGTWSQVASLSNGRYQAGLVVLNKKIYAVGGCDSWTCLNTAEVYDAEDNCWKQVTPMTVARRGCGVAVFNGKIHVIGGHDGSRSLNSVEIYDPETNLWSAGPSLNSCRANVGVAVVGDRLYACGGFSGKSFLSSVEFLERGSEDWNMYVSKQDSLHGSSSETSLSDHEINHSLSRSSLLSDEPLVEVEEAQPENSTGNEVD
ncbi:Influenza virus NS1A-binding -like protein [Halotydeus destructor]|nr:Influenza virus NS1A-binding -like protein [Halotydeus destructor]